MVVSSDPSDAGGAQTTVFIVDDDEAVRDSLTVLLEAAGLHVAAFASGKAFLAARDPRQHGCLLLDLDLSDTTGPEVLRGLADGAALPVIVITGRRGGPLRTQAEAAGPVAVLEKPFEERALLKAIRAALGSRGPAR